MPKIKATIFIPTYNGEKYLRSILRMIFKQKVDFAYEVLIIDSGSTDNTLDIIESFSTKHANLTLHKIPNSEFGHGKTRQLAAEMAKGDFIVYLSHDAVPAHELWLYEMLKPFELSEAIVAVMGKQVPRQNCPPIIKYDINAVFDSFGPDFGTSIFYKDTFIKDRPTYDMVRFYSDVNSAARRKTLLEQIPYQDVQYAEDQLFGQDVLEYGLMKAYAPRGTVSHSNDMLLKDYHKRIFDEIYGMRRANASQGRPNELRLLLAMLKAVVRDSARIIRDGQYGRKRKVYWLLINPLFHVQKLRGTITGYRVGVSDDARARKYSLERSD